MSIWKDLSRAKDILSHGGIVGFPTETVYGLGASIQSDSAIKKIFAIKERPFFDPLIVHICDYAQIDGIAAQWSPTEQKLAEMFWPGPLTIVTRKRSHLNPMITAGLDTVGIRMPSHAVARRLLREFGTPLAAPSANKFGKTSPTRWDHVKSEFPKEDLFVLRGGESEVGIESTVIQIFEDAQKIDVQILRPGILTKSDLEKALRDLGTKSFSIQLKSSSASPGSTETHYQPQIPLVISQRSLSAETVRNLELQLGLSERSRYSELNLNPDPRLAARDLYHQMRALSQSGAAWIFVRKSSDRQGEIWDSIWNRLEKAATLTLK